MTSINKTGPSSIRLFFFLALLSLFCTAKLSAQSPGGVATGLEIWLKADADFTYNGATDAEWLDQSSNGLVLNANLVEGPDSDSAPVLNNNAQNFNAGIVFDGVDNGLSTVAGAADFNFSEVTVISMQQVVAAATTTSNTVWHYGVDGQNDMALFAYPQDYGFNVSLNTSLEIEVTDPVLDNDEPFLFDLTANNTSSELYVNFKEVATSTAMTTLPNNGAFMIGIDADTATAQDGNNHLEGTVGEVLVYDRKLTETERLRIQTYLAIKYGITIDQTTITDYLASDETVIWDASENSGYDNDIFGIGRDDASGLDQKVSRSVNTDAILTIALDNDFTAANTNASRTTAHTIDKQFLMIANNNGATSLQPTELDASSGFDLRIGREWKVDATNFSQNISLKFEGYNQTWSIIATADGDFSSGVTTVGKLNTNGEFTTTTALANGLTFTLAKIQEAPGGVGSSFQLWLKADTEVTLSSGSSVNGWDDQSPNLLPGTQANVNNQPVLIANDINFHPSIDFQGDPTGAVDADFDYIDFGLESLDLTNKVSVYYVGNIDQSGPDHYVIGQEDGFARWRYANGFMQAEKDGTFYADILDNFTQEIDRNYIHGYVLDDTSGFHTKNGLPLPSETFPAGNWPTDQITLVGGTELTGEFSYDGQIAEIIVYNNSLGATEQKLIESYLAVKYGITLDQTSQTDYLASGSTVIWDASDNTGYTTDIFGIGRDDTSGLDQRVSKSVNDGTILTLALDADFAATNTDAGRTTAHANDKQFLMFAHNNGGTTTQATELDASTGFNLRLAREWKADVTNFTQNVNLKFEGYDETWSIISTADGDFSSGVTTIGALNTSGEFTTSTAIADGLTFTLAKFQETPGGITGNLAIWLKADAGVTGTTEVTAWDDQSPISNGYTAAGSARPTLNVDFANYNPSITFDGVNNFMTRASDQTLGTGTAYFVFTQNTASESAGLLEDNNISLRAEQWRNTERMGITVYSGGTLGNTGDYVSTTTAPNSTLSLVSFEIENGGPVFTISSEIDGTKTSSTVNTSGASNRYIPSAFITRAGNDFQGNLAEVITFGKILTSSEKNQLETYLAIKYGISLDQTIATDYVDSSGTPIWDASENTGYDNDIYGIGRDDTSGLNQKVSRSVNDTNGPILATTLHFTEANNDASRTAGLANGNFMVMGHNNGTNNSFTLSFDGGTNNRSARVWKIDETGTVGNVFFAIPKSAYTFPSGTPILVLSDDTTFDTDDTMVTLLDDGTYLYAQINAADGDLLAMASMPPGFTLSETALTIDENSGTGTFTVKLDVGPTSDVVIDISSDDTNEATVDETDLTFTSANWNTPQTVTVTGVDDTDLGEDTATITAAVNDTGSDDSFDALADKTVAITLSDDDISTGANGTLISAVDASATSNGSETETITIQLKNDGGDDLAIAGIDITFSATGSAVLSNTTAVTDANGTATVTLTNAVQETVDITATGDFDDDAGTAQTAINNGSPLKVVFSSDGSKKFLLDAIADANVDENSGYTGPMAVANGNPVGTVTYTLGGTDAADFTIDANSGVVSMVARNFENPEDDDTDNVYEVTITATDNDSNTDSEDWTVTVDDVTETVSFTIDAITDTNVSENMAYSSVMPSLSGDAPIGDVTYTLGGTDAADFTIDANSGVVSMAVRNFENPEDDDTDNVYEVTITATDGDSNADSEDWTVTVTDITETVTFTIDVIADVTVDENTGYTSVTPSLSGDAPIGDVSYALADVDSDDFSIDPDTGIVSMVAKDFENPTDSNTNSIYLASIVATDADGNTATQSWDVTVTDVTETVNFTIDAIADVVIDENLAYTGATPNLSGDAPIGEITYALAGVDSDDFTINTNTGVVSMVAKDFENPTDSNTNSIYLASIVATDADGNTAALSWDVTVTDVTENVSFAIDAIADTTIDEETPYTGPIPSIMGTPVGNVVFTVGGADAAIFSIDNATGQVFMPLRSFENPDDVNDDNTYEVSITATDEDGNNASEDWTVTLLDVAEVANFTINAIPDANIDENAVYTGPTPTLSGEAPIGDVTYTLAGVDAADFTINGSTGIVSMMARDFENPVDNNNDNSYELSITATDADGNSATESWSVIVLDFDEGEPDADGDGIPDNEDDFPNDPNEDTDTDGDGTGDNEDDDDDGDGTPDDEDDFPLNENEDTDSDGDGTGDNADTDDDDDGIPDTEDVDVDGDGIMDNGTDSDGDGINDENDDVDDRPDSDGDGVPDSEDAFPNDPDESIDADGDGIGANSDLDDTDSNVGEDQMVTSAEAFTPNGDGINDTWVIQGIENHPNAIVTVYNRYGHEVFKAQGYQNDWTGRNASASGMLPAGSYYYVIQLGNGSAPMDGWIFINY